MKTLLFSKQNNFLFVFLSLTTSIQAKELTSAERLNKLSTHLRGIRPILEEYQALEKTSSVEIPIFFQQKTSQYLNSPEHMGKMVDRLSQLFRFRTREKLPELTLSSSDSGELLNGSGFELLIKQITEQNLNWDNLLTTPNYPLYSPGPNKGNSDLFFLRVVAPELQEKEKGYFTYTPLENDLRFGGALTTSRFFGRYSTTNLNKNRGRAAAIFRIFLCDEMRAIVEPSSDEEAELLKKAFPPPPSVDRNHARLIRGEDPHGSQAACMSCHYKLDPIGRSFITSGAVLSDLPAPGALVYKRKDGSLLEMKGRGLGELTRALTAQPEYLRCQVSHFWKWFIQADRLPSEERMAELVAHFEKRGRKVNDFISYLVNEPEFYTENENPIPNLLSVKPILNQCANCHDSVLTQTIPDFSKFPIGGTETTHQNWIEKITNAVDLVKDGLNRKMPPANSVWQPSQEEIQLLKGWIAGGARDSIDKPSILEETAQKLLNLSGPYFVKTTPQFRDTFKRYLSGHDIFRMFHQKFPSVPLNLKDFNSCQELNDKNRAVVGDPNPFNGELVHQRPSPSFVRWYGECLIAWITKQMELDYAKSMRSYFGEEVATALAASAQEKIVTDPKSGPWKTVPYPLQQQITRHLIQIYLNPEEAKGDRLTDEITQWMEKKYSDATVYDAFKKILFFLGTEDPFLTY